MATVYRAFSIFHIPPIPKLFGSANPKYTPRVSGNLHAVVSWKSIMDATRVVQWESLLLPNFYPQFA